MRFLTSIIFLFAWCVSTAPEAAARSSEQTGEFTTSFEEVAGYARLKVLARRLFDSMQQQSLKEGVAVGDIDPGSFTIDPREEEWRVFLPETNAGGQAPGLLIWYADDMDDEFPEALVQAAESANMSIVAPIVRLKRDDPFLKSSAMGLHGLNWFARHYPVNQSRLLVGGHEDGAAIAQALLSGYPDIFTGAVLTDGGVAPGTAPVFVHGKDLQQVLRNNGRIVLVSTSENKVENAAEIMSGYTRLCVNAVESMPADAISAAAIQQAIIAALEPAAAKNDPACLDELQAQMKTDLAAIDSALENRQGAEGLKLLRDFHANYDALAVNETMKRLEILQEDYERVLREAGDFIQYRNNLQVPPPPPPQNSINPGGGSGGG